MHATICDIIADLVQNGFEAGAKRVALDVATSPERIEVTVTDNGKGMDAATLKRAVEPFYTEPGKHDKRKVGLGLPFLYQTAEQAGGKAEIQSEPGVGTKVHFTLDAKNWDTPPMGDLPETVLELMAYGEGRELELRRRTPTDEYRVSKGELAEAIGGDFKDAGTLGLAKTFLKSQEENLA